MVTGVDESYFSLAARFWAAMTMTLHGTFGTLLLYGLSRAPAESVSASTVMASVILTGSAVSAGWGLYRAKKSRESAFVHHTCAPVPFAVLLHWLLVPFSLPSSLAHTSWFLYTLWMAPSVLAALCGLMAVLLDKSSDQPKGTYETENSTVSLPILSSAAAILSYGFLGSMAFGLTAGFSTDYMPGPIIMGAAALCVPFFFLAIGFSSALARRTARAGPILVAAVLSLIVTLPTLLIAVGGLGILLYLVVAVPLIWPTVRARQIARAENAAKGSLFH